MCVCVCVYVCGGGSRVQAALRGMAATYLAEHPDQFRPFLTNDDGDPMTAGRDEHVRRAAGRPVLR
jgi:hypothetical protein